MEKTAKKTPKVSIGMPVYNGEKFIRDALDSLLVQTFTDFELIISDNASTDGTGAICQEYKAKDTRIRYVQWPENRGVAANFIFVLDKAVGEYFMWAACDDSWSNNWIEVLLSNFEEDDCGLFGRYIEGFAQVSSCPDSFLKHNFAKFFYVRDTSGKCYYSYALYKRNILIKSKKWLSPISVGGDQIYLLSLLRYGNLRFIDGCTFKYRVHDGSEASRQNKNYGAIKRALFSYYPMDYYGGAIRAVPGKFKLLILCLIPVKYCYEQFPKWVMVMKKFLKYLTVR